MTELICIVCPKGCRLHVDEEHDYAVTGNACSRGSEYGKTELKNPTRVLTSVVKVTGSQSFCCPVKTDGKIAKNDIFQAMEVLKPVLVHPPIRIGDVIAPHICGTDVNWVATKNIP